MVNFHLPLPDDLNRELRDLAAEEDRPATEVARELLRAALFERRRARRRLEIKAWAERNAGSELDLDTELEAAGLEAIEARRAGRRSSRRK